MTGIITSRLVPLHERASFLPNHAGKHFLRYESLTYCLMEQACDAYSGGLWTFHTLSNGGFFMAPDMDGRLQISWIDNYYDGEMSAEAAGIGISLMAQSQMAFITNQPRFSEAFHALRDYALEHTEAGQIFRFID